MGAIFAKLTKPAVAVPGQPPQFYPNDAAAGQALAQASAATAAPGTSNIINPQINPDGSEGGTVVNNAPPVAPQPKLTHPAFADAVGSGGPFSSELTTKG